MGGEELFTCAGGFTTSHVDGGDVCEVLGKV